MPDYLNIIVRLLKYGGMPQNQPKPMTPPPWRRDSRMLAMTESP
jgi:hypothetical protein